MGFLFGEKVTAQSLLMPNPLPGVPRRISDPIGNAIMPDEKKKAPAPDAPPAMGAAPILYPSTVPQDAGSDAGGKSLLGE